MAYPDDKSEDWTVMSPFWNKVSTILDGQDAIRAGKEKFLPKFPKEQQVNYDFRLSLSKFTNIFGDIIDGLASKPFAKELGLSEESPESIETISEDIDGRGNNLHVFAADTFYWGIANAIDWILIDYPATANNKTLADEKQSGVRPYWVRIPAINVIDVKSKVVNGKETLTLIKIEEKSDKIVRTFMRDDSGAVTWKVEEKGDDGVWLITGNGVITIGIIPIVPFITGRRRGYKWQFHPPMKDAANLQVTLYQNESDLEYIRAMTCFPMLAGNGVTPPTDQAGQQISVPVGPQAVLYAPPNSDGSHGEWKWIEPSAQSLKFVADQVVELKKDLRELGKQPLTAQSSNLTVVTTMFAAQKGNSAVQAWALRLKDALEQALMITGLWMGEKAESEVKIFTDFGISDTDDNAVDNLVKLRTAPEPQISLETLWEELKRRNVLSPEFDPVKELDRLTGIVPEGENQP
jgi:hypothetical protein